FVPLAIPLFLLVPFGPLLAWKRGDLAAVSQRLLAAFGISLGVMLVVLIFIDRASALAAVGFGLATWLIAGAATDLVLKAGLPKVSVSVALRRLAGLPRSVYGTALAHAGLGLAVMGIVSVTALQAERFVTMKPGETTQGGRYVLRYEGSRPPRGPNFVEARARVTGGTEGGAGARRVPRAQGRCTRRGMPTAGAGIRTCGLSQLCVSRGDRTGDGGIGVRAGWKPLVTLIWLGALVMMAGGTLSLLDRRLRVGAPARRKRRTAAEEATA